MSVQIKTRGRPRSAVPAYRLHKRSGQAVVTVASRDIYLGRHGSEESRRRYGEIIAQVAAGRPITSAPSASGVAQPSQGPTVDQLTVVFLDFAAGHYRKNGKPTSEIDILKCAIAPLHEHYGDAPAESFGPKLLKQYRDKLIARGLTRNTVNSFVGRIRRIFRHAVAEELIGPESYQRLAAVEGLRRGRTEARESEPVRPVGLVAVACVLPYVTPIVSAMIRVQRLTGMRPGEVCAMRWEEIDTSGSVWLYRPSDHKLKHHGRDRTVAIGPRAQEILRARRRLRQAGPVFPGGNNGTGSKCFTSAAYRRGITRGGLRTGLRDAG